MEEGESISLVLFSGKKFIVIAIKLKLLAHAIHAGVQYLTGQYFDIHAMTEAAHSKVNFNS